MGCLYRGKRESRRLMGDLVLREQDILNDIQYEDATFTTTWESIFIIPNRYRDERGTISVLLRCTGDKTVCSSISLSVFPEYRELVHGR